MKLHILHAAPFPFYTGGIDTWLASFLYFLGDENSIELYCLGSPKENEKVIYDDNGIVINYFGEKSLLNNILKLSKKLRKNLQQGDKVLILSTIPLGLTLLMNVITFKRKKIKTIISIRGQITKDCIVLKKSIFVIISSYFIELISCHLSNTVVSNGIDTAKYLKAYFRIKSITIPNAISKQNLRNEAGTKLTLRRSQEEVIILHLGTIRPIKGIPFIVECFDKYYLENPESRITLHFVGKGDISHIKKLTKHKNKIFVHGEQSDVLSYIKSSDYAINFSGGSGVSNSLLECLGEGVPVIAKNNLTFSQVLNSKNGYLIDSREDFYSLLERIELNEVNFVKEQVIRSIEEYKWECVKGKWEYLIN